jgi:hypothetical protein
MTASDWPPGYTITGIIAAIQAIALHKSRTIHICPMCGATPGKIGIGCLQCEMCHGDPGDGGDE